MRRGGRPRRRVGSAEGGDASVGADCGDLGSSEGCGAASRRAVKAAQQAVQPAKLRLQQLIRWKVDQDSEVTGETKLVDKLVACTFRINNFPVAADDLYSNHKLGYITRQVIEWCADDANFTKPSAKVSAST